jgi:hypothetical protein
MPDRFGYGEPGRILYGEGSRIAQVMVGLGVGQEGRTVPKSHDYA